MSPSNQIHVVEIVKWLYASARQAWPFLIGQSLVLLFLIWQWIELELERKACREWAGNGSSSRNSLLVEQLKLYTTINESTRNGRRGAAMTDFSDRIDSLLEGIAGRLYNTINLFVIVGISGTFFGMGWFAKHLPSTNPTEVNQLLQQAMAQSFPIGFIGLLLTLIFHPIISLREQALREAVTDAVNRSLKMSSEVAAANDWNAVLKLLGDLPPKIGEIIQRNQEVLVTRFIDVTDKSIQPLKELFAESRSEWKETVTKLDQQSKRVSTAVDELTEGVRKLTQPITSLTESISQVKDTVTAMQALAVSVAQETEKAAIALQDLQIGISSTSESLKAAADELEKLPIVASANLKESFSEVVKASGDAYRDFGERYTSSIAQIALVVIGNISGAAQTAGNTLGTIPIHEIPYPYDRRIDPEEFHVYRVQARLLRVKRERDSDLHLLLGDLEETDKRMIAEIPAAECAEGTGHGQEYRSARNTVSAIRVNSVVEIVGVGFFDFLHEQRGAAKNGIELHPVLSIRQID